ncbi:PDCD2 (predicted), partial [Pycnogonum litorale]
NVVTVKAQIHDSLKLSLVMETDSTKPVELGFLEKVQSWKLKCEYFPSKVGGYPAWLDLVGIPSCEAVRCDRCGKPCVFLMQMYSPGTDPKSFHRTIFVFICKNSGCYVRNENCGNIKVFRCQLRLKNDFYDDIPPPEVEHLDDEVNFTCNQKKQKSTILCCVCGCRGPQRCGRCRVKHYCSRDHQLLDWKSEHKFSCRPTSQKPSTEVTSVSGSDEKVGCCGVKSTVTRINNIEASSHSSFNLPEYKLINEEEIISDDESYDDNIKDSNQNA